MTFSLIPEEWWRDPRWMVLAEALGGRADRARRRDAALIRDAAIGMMCETASGRNDGYITRTQALDCCLGDKRILEALTAPKLGRPPYLHRPGEKCAERNCIDESPSWIDGFDYRICSYLKRNPSRKETELDRKKKKELNDKATKATVEKRDGKFCRYCRSGPLNSKVSRGDRRMKLTRDHENPDVVDDIDNIVTACASCNEYKGRNRSFEVGMELLDPPTPEQIEQWMAEGLRLFDRPWIVPATNNRTNAGPTSDQGSTIGPDVGPSIGPDVGPSPGPDTPDEGEARPKPRPEQQDQRSDQHREGSGSGRGGVPAGGGDGSAFPLPARAPDAPDIYTGRSRAAPATTGPPVGGGSRAP